jgi:hypothetical protein
MLREEVTAVLVCDDIRKENNGKDILIGVYSGDILLPSLPAQLSLAFWIEVAPVQVGSKKATFRIGFGGDRSAMIHTELEVSRTGPAAIALPTFLVSIDSPGDLTLEIQEGNGDDGWRLLKRKSIRISSATSSIVLPSLAGS